jgi:hypothetical protein
MKMDVVIRSAGSDTVGPEARVDLALESLRWSGTFVLHDCADPTVAEAAAKAYAWYLGYLLYSNAALVCAQATRSVVEHSRDGDRAFIEIDLEDGSGARVETITVSVPMPDDSVNPAMEASGILREAGLEILDRYAAAPAQAFALLAGRPFYALPAWLDRALGTARRLKSHVLPPPRAVAQAPDSQDADGTFVASPTFQELDRRVGLQRNGVP